MTGAVPDLVEPLVGFRAWRLDPLGRLHPWSLGAAGPWVPGANTAVCHSGSFAPAGGGGRRHRAPAARCRCGIHALADPADARLRGEDDQVVGAIAAWGEVEAHRSGFRAEHAAVVALALEDGAPPEARAAREAAAGRHGVALVDRAELPATARAFGTLLDPERVREPDPRRERLAARHTGETGIAVEEHLWARPGPAHVDLGLTEAFGALLGPTPELTLPPVGMAVAAGDVLATATGSDGQTYLVWCCVTGTVAAVAPEAGDGWLVRIADSDWTVDQRRFTWGRRARTLYDAHVARRAAGHDVFGEMLCERVLHAPPVRCAADVLRELDRRRARPALVTTADVYAACAPQVHERVAADPARARAAARAGVALRVRTSAPDAQLTLVADAATGRVRVTCGPSSRPADLELSATAEVAARLFAGTLDVARALNARELVSTAPRGRTLAVLSVLKHVLPGVSVRG